MIFGNLYNVYQTTIFIQCEPKYYLLKKFLEKVFLYRYFKLFGIWDMSFCERR